MNQDAYSPPQPKEAKSFKLIVPASGKLKSSDYWVILICCAVGSFMLLMMIGSAV